jgi:hypothetical protein
VLCCYVVLACCFPEGPCSAVVVAIVVAVILIPNLGLWVISPFLLKVVLNDRVGPY